jgi:hypothetical protein
VIKINKKILLVLVLMFVAVPAAYSLRVLEFEDQNKFSCTQDGIGKFDFFYDQGEGVIDKDDFRVTADGEEVKGMWLDRDGKGLDELEKGKRAYFVSDAITFMDDKIYDMQLEYPKEDGTTGTIDFEMSCPGFVFACSLFEMNLDQCFNKDGVVYLEISGSGFGQKNYNDLITQFTYVLKGTRKRHEGSLEDSDAVISENGEGLFTIAVPLGYSITYAYIRGTPYGCDKTIDDFDTITYKKCETAPADFEPKTETKTTTTTTQAKTTTADKEDSADEPAEDEEEEKVSFFGRIWRAIASIFK